MTNKDISSGVVHNVPQDMKEELVSNEDVIKKWENLTPLARNEWICWVTSAKKQETREKRLHWMSSNLLDGKKRPCCWPGCPHR